MPKSKKPEKPLKINIAPTENRAKFGVNKILRGEKADSIAAWAGLYFAINVVGAARSTERAKRADLEAFLEFFLKEVGHDRIDGWTPAVTRRFQKNLQLTISAKTGERLKSSTVNRIMSTVRHFGRWLHKQRPLLAGAPLAGVKDIVADPPDWNGLTGRQVMRLKAACDQRLNSCTRANQNPLLEVAVFHVLLNSGLRAGELSALDLDQYHHRGFHEVLRKGKRVTKKVPLPSEARARLDRYIEEVRNRGEGPLLLSRYGKRLAPKEIGRICTRISKQASAHLPAEERLHLTPHKLRHTFLRHVADKHGVHYAQRLSGNVSIREVFRYTKPSDEEVEEDVEKLFD